MVSPKAKQNTTFGQRAIAGRHAWHAEDIMHARRVFRFTGKDEMHTSTLSDMFRRILGAEGQNRAATRESEGN